VTATVLFGLPQQEIASLIADRMARSSAISVATGVASQEASLLLRSGEVHGQRVPVVQGATGGADRLRDAYVAEVSTARRAGTPGQQNARSNARRLYGRA